MRENCKNQPKLKDVDLFKEELDWPWKFEKKQQENHHRKRKEMKRNISHGASGIAIPATKGANSHPRQRRGMVDGAARSTVACVGGQLVEIGVGGCERKKDRGEIQEGVIGRLA